MRATCVLALFCMLLYDMTIPSGKALPYIMLLV